MICPHCDGVILWKKITPELEKQIMEGHRLGWSLRDIGRIVGVSFSTARRVIHKELKRK